jgi:cell pole-organizing protein PopZ
MQTGGREPSMEDILASIKKVIAEEKELRAAAPPAWPENDDETQEEDVLELEEVLEEPPPLAPPVDLGPPLIDDEAADASRQALDTLSTVAASVPPPPLINPMEAMVREMLRPILKQWLDDHLPGIVDEHVKREITRITGRPL